MKREAIVTPLQDLSLAVRSETFNEVLVARGLKAEDLAPLAYASLIQGGLDRLAFLRTPQSALAHTGLPSHRLRAMAVRDYGKGFGPAGAIAFPSDYESGQEDARHKQAILWSFLADLAFAFRVRKPLVLFNAPPSAEGVGAYLPTDIAVPVGQLLRRIQPAVLAVPTPAFVLDVDAVARFEELFDARGYRRYASAHQVLTQSDAPKASVLRDIRLRAREFASKLPQLTLEDSLLSTLTLSSRFIDLVLGKIPGALGKLLVDGAVGFLSNRQRLVLYDGHDVFRRIVGARLEFLFSQKTLAATMKQRIEDQH